MALLTLPELSAHLARLSYRPDDDHYAFGVNVTAVRYVGPDARGGAKYRCQHDTPDSDVEFVAVFLSASAGRIVAEWVA